MFLQANLVFPGMGILVIVLSIFFQLKPRSVCLNELADSVQTGSLLSGEGCSWTSRSVSDEHPLGTGTGQLTQRGGRAAPRPPAPFLNVALSLSELDGFFGVG